MQKQEATMKTTMTTTTRRWWVRLTWGDLGNYGRWIPTGCVTQEAARDYVDSLYGRNRIKEYLLW